MLSGFFDPFFGGGTAIPISSIRKIGRELEQEGRAPVRQVFVDGEAEPWTYSARDIESLMRRPTQLLPAQPGTKLMWGGVDKEDGDPRPWVYSTALIAFGLCLDGLLRPVTPAGVDDGSGEPDYGWFVGLPDGGIYGMGADAEQFAEEDELKAHLIRAYRLRQPS